jgi:hypothetical protein
VEVARLDGRITLRIASEKEWEAHTPKPRVTPR